MADMTQPEIPERASIPASEHQSSRDVVEPTHIGIARHREAREGFTPPPLQSPEADLNILSSPADRTSVEALRREAKRMAARSQTAEAEENTSSEFLGEPDMPRQESGFPLGRTIAGGLGALAVTAAGFLGFNKIRSGDDGSERPGVIITDPTLEPATPPPTFTPEVTQEPAATETPTPTEVVPGPGANGKYETIDQLPLSEVKKNAIKELIRDDEVFIITDRGMVTIEKALQTRPSKIELNGEAVSAAQLHTIALNTNSYPNASEMYDKAIDVALYEAWKIKSKNTDITLEQYMATKDSTDYSFEVKGYEGTSDTVSYQKVHDDEFVIIRWVADASRSNILDSVGNEMTFELKDGVTAIGLFEIDPGAIDEIDDWGVDREKYQPTQWVAGGLRALSAEVPKTALHQKFSLARIRDSIMPAFFNIQKEILPQYVDENVSTTEGFDGVFTVTGSKWVK